MKKLLIRLLIGVFVVRAESAIVAYFGIVEPLSYWVTVYVFCISFTYVLDGLAYLWRGLTKRAADKGRA